MANKWNYKHGVQLPLIDIVFVVNAPNDNVVGNVRYLDPNNPNSSDIAVNAGCANVPFKTFAAAHTSAADSNTPIICAKGIINETGNPSRRRIYSDCPLQTIFNGNMTTLFSHFFHGCITLNYTGVGSLFPIQKNCIINHPTANYANCLVLRNMSTQGGYNTNNVYISVNLLSASSLHYNCVPPTQTAATGFYNKVFWLGTLNLNALSSDLNTICAQIDAGTITEAQGIAQVETDLGLTANTLKNNGFRLLNPHFINISKGNFNIDFLNYDCTAILALRDSWGWIINRGVRCEYPLDFVGAVGAGFGEAPNLSDGFSGELYSRNINSLGVITNTAYDTVLVSKKYILPRVYTLENINFFDKLISTAFPGLSATENDGTDTPNCYTYHFIGVKAGVLESVFNSTNNTFSYSTGVLTCDFPRFMWNRSTQLNKDDNTIYGQIENGTFDLDYTRNIYKAGVKEFRIIAVKKGV